MRRCTICQRQKRGFGDVCRPCVKAARPPQVCRDCRVQAPELTKTRRLCDACRAQFYVTRSEKALAARYAPKTDQTIFWQRVKLWERATGRQHEATLQREREANDWSGERATGKTWAA